MSDELRRLSVCGKLVGVRKEGIREGRSPILNVASVSRFVYY